MPRTSLPLAVASTFLLAIAPITRAQTGTSDNLSDKRAWQAAATNFGGFKADTRPKLDTTMQFSFATEVREILVTGGQSVKKGDMLMKARDLEIVGALEQQRLLATSDLEVQGSEKALELAVFRLEQLKGSTTFSPLEFEEASIASQTARIQRDQAKVNLQRQQFALKQLEGQAERYYLIAPFDGQVEEVMVEVGQGVSEQQKALRLVNTDSLILDAAADTDQTLRLNLGKGGKAWVLIDVPDKPAVVEGVIDYVSPVADSVSQTRRVRVEIENTAKWPAGVQARVRFIQPTAAQLPTTAAPAIAEKSGGVTK